MATDLERPPVKLPTHRTTLFDPAPEFRALREERPLCRLEYPDGHIGWLVTSHDLARKILVDRRIGVQMGRIPVGRALVDPSNAAGDAPADAPNPFDPESELGKTLGKAQAGNMLAQDGERHIWLRRLHTPYFTTRGVFGLRDRVEEIVSDQMDLMERTGPPVEFVSQFALPVAALGACALLGVPPSDVTRFTEFTRAMFNLNDEEVDAVAILTDYVAYIREVVERKRAEPGNDVLSEIATNPDLTDDDLVGAMGFLLFPAAHQTTFTQMSLSMFLLLHERDRWETLCANPTLIDNAVEELLRYLTIFQLGLAAPRVAFEDVEVEGQVIKAGDSVWVSFPSANRDDNKFSDPNECDFSRDPRGHMAFGHGVHMCLGQHFARLELRVGLRALTERFPTLRLAAPADELPMYAHDFILYGVKKLPLEW